MESLYIFGDQRSKQEAVIRIEHHQHGTTLKISVGYEPFVTLEISTEIAHKLAQMLLKNEVI